MNICELIPCDAIKIPLESTTKQEAIDELVELMASVNNIPDVDELKEVVWTRELQRSTGIGEGLAIPHGKSLNIDHIFMAVGCTSEPIEFEAIDDKPVHIIILLISPSDRIAEHIQALGKVSRLMSDNAFREKIVASSTAEEVHQLIEDAEQEE